MSATRLAGRAALVLALVVALTGVAAARPTYFQTFTGLYGIMEGDNLNACGVCHLRWTGTGARNPFGTAVEQQLYVGKPIAQALQDIEGDDTDGDGFTNGDEIMTFMTLPGYSCSDFHLAIGAPADYHTYVTPMVASCLEPLDIRVSPIQIAFLTEVGESDTVEIEVFNNGSDFPLSLDGYALLPGSHAALGITGPATPTAIPVGGSVILQVSFTPVGPTLGTGTVRITSDDPDEGTLDVPITAFGIFTPLAPADDRAACLRDVDKQFRRYAKTHLREWSRCYLDEVTGVACDTGRRDLQLLQAEQKLRARIGGPKDRRCAANGVTPSLLGYPDFCGGGCGDIAVTTFSTYVDCLVCRQDEAMQSMLRDAVGTAPPDLPPNEVAGQAAGCQKLLLKGSQKGIAKALKARGGCEYANVTAASPVDCTSALAGELATVEAQVDGALLKCRDTTDLLGCLFEPPAAPGCLGDGALSIADDLTGAVFGLDE